VVHDKFVVCLYNDGKDIKQNPLLVPQIIPGTNFLKNS